MGGSEEQGTANPRPQGDDDAQGIGSPAGAGFTTDTPPDDDSQSPATAGANPEASGQPQELGRVERPPAEQFQGKRRLLLAPLLVAPPPEPDGEPSEGQTIYERYWDQVRTQVDALAAGLGGLHHVYHEAMVEGGAEGLAFLESFDPNSHALVQVRCQAGATLEPTESLELVKETIDLQRCMMLPFASDRVPNRIQEWLAESHRSRCVHMGQQIDRTLQVDQTGLLLVNERHQIQFPADMEVFYVSPPALDEYRRWIQNWSLQMQQAAEAEAASTGHAGDGEQAGDEAGPSGQP